MDELMAQFQSFGFNPGALISQIGAALGNPAATQSGSLVPLETIREIGRTYIAAQSQLPVGSVDLAQCTQALDIANTWLDAVTIFPALTRTPSTAWSRKEWLDTSAAGWQKLVEPLAQGMASALTSIVEQGQESGDFEEGAAAGAPGLSALLPILRSFMGALFASQLGNSVGALATSVTGVNDVAIPLFTSFDTLAEDGSILPIGNYQARLIPQNLIGWGEGLELPEEEIRIFLALREAAAARLFSHTPWLAQYIYDAVAAFSSGIRVDIQTIQEQAESAMNSGELDISNPQSIQIAINQGIFTPEQTPKQEAALARLEIALALIEGWIDHVTTQAASEKLPSFAALNETLRRRRATSAPTQQLFATLFGLQVSPRKSRECSQFWSEVTELISMAGRDSRWEDPALLPSIDDISDAKKFLDSTTVPDDLSGLI
jgi:putative hydrolase